MIVERISRPPQSQTENRWLILRLFGAAGNRWLAQKPSHSIQPTPKLPDLGILRLHRLGQRSDGRDKLADKLIHALTGVA